MTNANVKKRKRKKRKHQKTNRTLELTITKTWSKHRGMKEILQKLYWHMEGRGHGSSRTQTTEVLLRWKYVRQAVRRTLYTLELFAVSEAKIFRYVTNTCRGTKTKNVALYEKTLILLICSPVRKPPQADKAYRISYWQLRQQTFHVIYSQASLGCVVIWLNTIFANK